MLLFIIKIMNNKQWVSEFVIPDEPQGPKMHQLLRSRAQEPIELFITTQSKSILNQSKEIIVRVENKTLTENRSAYFDGRASGVRGSIDDCLAAVESMYSKERRNRTIKTAHFNDLDRSSVAQQQIISDKAIHRIDSNIIKQYVSTIYRDYKIRNRFGDQQPIQPKSCQLKTFQQQSMQRVQFNSNDQTVQRRSNSLGGKNGKQFLNITQISKISRNSFSSKKNGVIEPIQNNLNVTQTYRFKDSPNLHTKNAQRLPQTSLKTSQLTGKITEDFKYCINCQKLILTANINYHQRFECHNFPELYKMSFKQLTSMVHQKIERIKQKLRQTLQKFKLERSDNFGLQEMVEKMENYVSSFGNNQINFEDINCQKYSQFEKSIQNPLNQAIDLTKKLHWFTLIHRKLSKQSNNSDRVGNSEVLKLIQTPATRRQIQLSRAHHQNTPINVLRFHPHLHQALT